MDLRRMASYPFMSSAILYMKSHPDEFAGIEELATDILFEGAREKAMIRIRAALEREEIPRDFHSQEECREEILSYIISRILIAAVADTHLIRWYSLAEAVRARRLLEKEPMPWIEELANDVGFTVESIKENQAQIGFVEFLEHSSSLKSFDWKLSNQQLHSGTVTIERAKVLRLIQEALRTKFETEIAEMRVPDIIKQLFKDQLEEIMGITTKMKESYDHQIAKVVIPRRFPPCIHNLLSMTRNGENVSHSGRFAMTSFLLHIGMSIDEIVSIFKVSPDFREDLARYQVEHIGGEISGTDYESMACKTMVTYGLCIGKDILCQKIRHPLSYYEARNDDALPESERILRRALAASSEIARALKIPIRKIQNPVTTWFSEHAVIEIKEDTHGERAQDIVNTGGMEVKNELLAGVGVNGNSESGLNVGGEVKDQPITSHYGTKRENEGSKQTWSKKENHHNQNLSKNKNHHNQNIGKDLKDPIQKPIFRFDGARDDERKLFRLTVTRAWLNGIKAIHPGTMETTYFVGTTGLVEDSDRRALRLLPVLDFEYGQIMRDFQRTGRELEIEGQIFSMSGRRFLHVIRVNVGN